MRPEDIRKLYRAEGAATAEEARAAREEARTDSDQARRFLATLYSLSVEDSAFALLLRLFLEGIQMRMIEERAAADDAFALDCAKLIQDLMDGMARPARGRPAKPARSA